MKKSEIQFNVTTLNKYYIGLCFIIIKHIIFKTNFSSFNLNVPKNKILQEKFIFLLYPSLSQSFRGQICFLN